METALRFYHAVYLKNFLVKEETYLYGPTKPKVSVKR